MNGTTDSLERCNTCTTLYEGGGYISIDWMHTADTEHVGTADEYTMAKSLSSVCDQSSGVVCNMRRTGPVIQGIIHDIHGPPEHCYIRESEVYS